MPNRGGASGDAWSTGWAPLRAADTFLPRTPQSKAHVPLTPLSQMPMPQTQPSPLPTPSWQGLDDLARVQLSQFRPEELDEEEEKHIQLDAWDDVAVSSEPYEDEIAPTSRAALRLHTGFPVLDTYAGQRKFGGAFLPGEVAPALEADADTPYGFPVGSALEIVGPPGSGKTSWCLQMAISERLRHMGHALHGALDELGSQPDDAAYDPSEWLDANVVPWCAQVMVVGTSCG